MKNNALWSRGFSLIEILVSMTILAILSAIGIASFNSYQNSQLLSANAVTVQNTLVVARTRSIANIKPSACLSPSQTLLGYKFNVLTATTYRVDIVCATSTQQGTVVTLPQNVFFDTANSSTAIQFQPFSGIGIFTNPIGGNGIVKVCQNPVTSACPKSKIITVTQNGSITIQ